MLTDDACSKPPITIRSHNLHGDDITGFLSEIASYHERTIFSFLFFWLLQTMCFLAFLWPSLFCLPLTFPDIDFLLDFCDQVWDYHDIIQSMTTHGIITPTQVQHFFVEYLFI